ncbi:hypothetical protein NIES4075_71320 [Tolypothrix sp. NIES-4075]|uniref:hypothetical protein n=1 Tax=Tolypothrix sp. NIES-4075 TaxID=2005459 RepID=UPI000B6D1C4F|nr:hypothetical protein [Tolypothrix sp. NIES-4075]GAX46111.1 hypothetical protein NIES4075_71320 [Tolypothrix sp. NIES-4075]
MGVYYVEGDRTLLGGWERSPLLYTLIYTLTCQSVNVLIEEKGDKNCYISVSLAHQRTKVVLLARKLGSEQKIYGFEMPKYVDLSRYWTEEKNLSIQKAKEMTGLDKRTLSAAKKGQLERGQFETLFKLRDLASELAGKPLMLEEIFKDD